MTNNDIKKMIDARVEGRDIEKLFDNFIENVTDIVIDDTAHPLDDDEAIAMMDYIVEAVMKRFGYKLA